MGVGMQIHKNSRAAKGSDAWRHFTHKFTLQFIHFLHNVGFKSPIKVSPGQFYCFLNKHEEGNGYETDREQKDDDQ